MYEAADAEGLLAEVHQQTHFVAALVKVEQALLDVLVQDDTARLCLHDQLVGQVADHEIHAARCDHDPVVGNRNINLALVVEVALLQRQGERTLVVHLHAVNAELPLNIYARPEHSS